MKIGSISARPYSWTKWPYTRWVLTSIRTRSYSTEASESTDTKTEIPEPTQKSKRHRVSPFENLSFKGKVAGQEFLQAAYPTAEKLIETGLFSPGTSTPGSASRVNIVNPQLVDDTLQLLGNDLRERHQGCDLLELFPGSGLWSEGLHNLLQPRSHILVEPDKVYDPFLAPLLERPGVVLARTQPMKWDCLEEVLTSRYLPHQTVQPTDKPPVRNDSLLVTINLGLYPKKAVGKHASLSSLFLFQVLSRIPFREIFFKYGLVRLLIWCSDDEKYPLLPRSFTGRRRASLYAQLNCDWVHEIAGTDNVDPNRQRTLELDIISNQIVSKRARQAGIVKPPYRQNYVEKLVADHGADTILSDMHAGKRPTTHPDVPWIQDYAELDSRRSKKSKLTEEENQRLNRVEARLTRTFREFQAWQKMVKLLNDADKIYQEEGPEKAALKEQESVEFAERTFKTSDAKGRFKNYYEDLRSLTHDILFWDQRKHEPLHVTDNEFLPNSPLCLLDIQPKPLHPTLATRGLGTNRSGNFADAIINMMFEKRNESIDDALGNLWFGANTAVIPNAPSLRDPEKGGRPLKRAFPLQVRNLNETQLIETVEAFMAWPFRPNYAEFASKNKVVDDDTATELDSFDEISPLVLENMQHEQTKSDIGRFHSSTETEAKYTEADRMASHVARLLTQKMKETVRLDTSAKISNNATSSKKELKSTIKEQLKSKPKKGRPPREIKAESTEGQVASSLNTTNAKRTPRIVTKLELPRPKVVEINSKVQAIYLLGLGGKEATEYLLAQTIQPTGITREMVEELLPRRTRMYGWQLEKYHELVAKYMEKYKKDYAANLARKEMRKNHTPLLDESQRFDTIWQIIITDFGYAAETEAVLRGIQKIKGSALNVQPALEALEQIPAGRDYRVAPKVWAERVKKSSADKSEVGRANKEEAGEAPKTMEDISEKLNPKPRKNTTKSDSKEDPMHRMRRNSGEKSRDN